MSLTPASQTDNPQPSPAKRAPTILIVEDDKGIRNLARLHLDRLGYQAVPVSSGQEALDWLKDQTADLLLLDFGLPDMTGQNLLDEIENQNATLPFLVTTGHGSEQVAVEFMKRGALDYIIKDEKFWENLPKAVERALDHLKMARRLEKAKSDLRASEERFRALTEHTTDVTLILDDDLRLNYASPSVERILGVPPEDFIARQLVAALHPEDLQALNKAIEHSKSGSKETIRIDNFRIRHKDGNWLNMEGLITDLRHLPGVDGTVIHCRDITDRMLAEKKLRDNETRLKHLAHHDTLTNLPNRMMFKDRLQQAMAKAKRSGQEVAIVFLDLDRFKKINDSLGHEIGDRLLQQVASRLKTCVRESDTVARLGGDEFVLILEDVKETGHVVGVAQKILSALTQPFSINGYQLYVTTSIGISLFPTDGEEASALMKCADIAMYRVKEQGRNNYQFYKPDMNARARELLLMESALRKAQEKDQLDVFYQPQLELSTGKLVGMESLLRWIHPEQGIICPQDFLPLAEDTGLIEPYGKWAILEACKQNRLWQDKGFAPISVSINISPRLFHKKNFVDTIRDILHQSALSPEYLELEVTECMVMHDVDRVLATMKELDRMGVKLTIDDFGTGYSCLSLLKRFPVSRLKIAQSFIKDVTTNPNDAAIADSIISLARSMNLEVIAEGVETPGQLRFLQERKCRMAQGFLFCHPLPPEELTRFFDLQS